jgi:hypothetical protein
MEKKEGGRDKYINRQRNIKENGRERERERERDSV